MLRFIGFVVVLACVFAAGVFVASPPSRWDVSGWRVPAPDADAIFRPADVRPLCSRDGAQTGVMYGVIRKVSGNTLTVADNGGGLQVVLSSAKTVIYAMTGEQPLSALRVGQFIRVVGVPGEAGLAARVIDVVR